MGVVYMANKAGKTVALKVISSGDLNNPQVRSRFVQEIQSLSLLRTPYVAPLLEFDIDAKNPWYAVEYISDMSLGDILKTSGSFTGKTWWNLAHNLLMALAAIHNAEVIHRDIKPGNILVTKGTPKLIDFGLAKPIADTVEKYHSTKINQVMGTPHYMSPEQWKKTKDVDGKTDVWAIGVTLIDAAGGKPWGNKESYEIQALLHNGKTPDLSSLDPAQKALVSVMLIPSADDRWSATKILKNFDSFYNYKEAPAAAQVKVAARPIVAPADQVPNKVGQDKIKVEGNRVVVEPNPRVVNKPVGENKPKVKSTNQAGSVQSYIKRYGKDILIFWLLTPFGWLLYKYFTDKEMFTKNLPSATTKGMKFWNVGFLLNHGLTLGLLGPLFSVPLAFKQRRALLTTFAAANVIAVWIFFAGAISTPNGGTLPTTPTVFLLANYFLGFFFPLVLRFAFKTKEAN